MKRDPDCIFCKIVAGEIPSNQVYGDDYCVAFMDISPINRGHLLVVPREHFETIVDIDAELYGRLASVLAKIAGGVQKALNPDGMNVMQLNGKAANQVVPHVHLHLVPRWKDDGETVCQWEPVTGNMSEIAETAELIRSHVTD